MEHPRWDSSSHGMGFSTPAPSHQAAGGTCGVLVICLGSAIGTNPTILGLPEGLRDPKESQGYPRMRCPPSHGVLHPPPPQGWSCRSPILCRGGGLDEL